MEFPSDIITDDNLNVYISGSSDSQNNIATSGTHQSNLNGQRNLFIAKLDTNSNRIWGTYLTSEAGLNNSQSCHLAIDSNHNIYVAGDELNNSFIGTAGTFQEFKNNYFEGFLVKLNLNGIKQWGTYFGGSGNESIYSICLDPTDNIYIAGQTFSSDFNTTSTAHQNVMNGSSDGFIIKFDTTGNRIWNTYYGGLGFDGFTGINYSSSGYIYATGLQRSLTNIATLGSFQPTTAAVTGGGMIIKFDLNGNRIWGSYIADNSTIHKTVLKNNSLCFLGITNNPNIATTGSLFDTFQIPPAGSSLNSGSNGYLLNFNIQTQQINWGTYFIDNNLGGLSIDNNDNVYFAGYTRINNNITTTNSFMPTKNPIALKNFLIKLNTSGQRIWGTYSGGNLSEQAGYCTVDSNNDIYICGLTFSPNGISTPGVHQEFKVGNSSLYIFKFKDCLSSTVLSSNSPICIGKNLQLNASGGTNYDWTGPNGFTSSIQNPIINNAGTLNSGTYSCSITGTGGCDNTVTINVLVGDITAPIPNNPNLQTITGDCNTIISTIPTATDNCAGLLNGTTTDPLNYTIPGNYIIHWNYNDGNGNSSTQNQSVVITATTLPSLTATQQFCIQQNATLNNIVITGQNIKWYDAQTGGNLLPTNTLLQNGTTYYATQTNNNCESNRVPVSITIYNTPSPTANSNQSFCSTANATLNDISISGTGVKWYDTQTGGNLLPANTIIQNATTYYSSQTLNGCESVNRTPITINLINTLNANDFLDYFCDDLNNGHEKIDLTSYNSSLISNTAGNTFSFYKSFSGAQNQTTSEKINNENDYQLNVGTITIYVRIDNVNTCHQIVELNLTLYSKPIIPIAEVTPICQGNTVTINAGNFDKYQWSTGETSSSILVSQAGNYSVTVTENHIGINCNSTKDFNVVNSNVATISQVITNDWTVNKNSITIVVTTSSVGDYQYSLDGNNYQNSNVFTDLNSGEYNIFIRDKNGCGTISEEVFLLMYPKYFTPNGDGNNDKWKIKFSNTEPGLRIKLFDRYGKFIKELDYSSDGWNGTFNGKELPSTDYWFVVTRSNGKEYRGHFAMKR
ncbi:T9SS type B sorting domain-containing protein [Flavobacterium sp.]|uniref:T9SS type B sorting domain-containing protein n=1 Tax=Flavobacterium sp. TaxID=239 RepID=UPI0038FD013B